MRGRPLGLIGHYCSLMSLDIVHPSDARPTSGSPRPPMLSCVFILFIHQMRGQCEIPIMLEGEGLEEVESFRYLGSIVDTQGGTEADVKTRISKARAAVNILRNVWKSRVIGKTTKIRLFNTNVKSVLLYGAETWRINKITLKRIQTFVNQCLRKIIGIQWMDKVSNKDIWERTSQVQIEI